MGQGNSNSGNYDYIGSGTPSYYEDFSSKLKKNAESVYGWTDAIEAGLLMAGGAMPWLEPFLLIPQTIVGGISMGAHVAEGLMIGVDTVVDTLDLKSSINGTIEREQYPDRYGIRPPSAQPVSSLKSGIEKTDGATILNNSNYSQPKYIIPQTLNRYGTTI
jgi:hypothetical protein